MAKDKKVILAGIIKTINTVFIPLMKQVEAMPTEDKKWLKKELGKWADKQPGLEELIEKVSDG